MIKYVKLVLPHVQLVLKPPVLHVNQDSFPDGVNCAKCANDCKTCSVKGECDDG